MSKQKIVADIRSAPERPRFDWTNKTNMADQSPETEPTPVVETPAEEVDQTNETADAPANGEEVKEKKKERKDPTPCDAPDEAEYLRKKGELDEKINELQSKIDNISHNIDNSQNTRAGFRTQRKNALDQLATLKETRIAANEEINKIAAQFEEIEKKRTQQRQFLRVQKDGLKFLNVVELDNAITKIEYKLSTSTLPPHSSSKLMADIRMLKAQRLSVMRYAEQRQLIEMTKDDTISLRNVRDENAKKARACRERESKLIKDLNEYRKNERTSNTQIEEGIKERKTLSSEKYKLQYARDGITRKYNNQLRNYTRWVEFQKYLKRKEAREKRKAEYEARKAAENGEVVEDEGDETDEKVVVHPYAKELAIISDLERYLRFHNPNAGKKSTSSTEEDVAPKVDVADRNSAFKGKGVVVASKKENINDEFAEVLGTKKKASKNKTKKVKDTSLNHIPDVFAQFKVIGVTIPLVTSAIDEALTALAEKKQYYETAPPPQKVARLL